MSPHADVDALVGRLTLAEKLRLVRGGVDPSGEATGYVPPVDRLDVPACSFTDGPLGVRVAGSVAFPATVALAASWDPSLAERFGRALADEVRDAGFDGVLSPGVNIARVPHGGRNFEYYGEDPHLTARLAARTVAGIESSGVLAVPKHFLANNQEHSRLSVSAEVDERALREIYLPATVATACDGDAGLVMAAYNRVDGVHVTQHRRLLTDLLKEELGFEGAVVSDWWGVRDGPAAARAGLDLEMPGVTLASLLTDGGAPVGPRTLARRWPPYLPTSLDDVLGALAGSPTEGPDLRELVGRSPFETGLGPALDRGEVSGERLDDMVRRLLRQYARVGLLDGDRPPPLTDRAARVDLAREIAIRGTVLLANDGVLPLDQAVDAVAVVGPGGDRAKVGGRGSSEVPGVRGVSPLRGIDERVDGGTDVAFVRGGPRVDRTLRSTLSRVLPGDRSGPGAAADAAAAADVAIVVVEDDAGEGRDRPSLALPGNQDALVTAVAGTDTPTVVVLATSGPVEMPWVDAVDALLLPWYGGQEVGRALAAVLFGDADPGGRLPVTFGRSAAGYPASSRRQYPGVEGPQGYPRAHYSEGVFVGYRHFDRANVTPLFPFGHGRSYAAFDYRDLALDVTPVARRPGTVTATVENVGDRRGREVVQAYVCARGGRFPRPPRELAGFAAVALGPGESERVTVPLRDRAFEIYDPEAGAWTVDADRFVVEVGRSSREPRLVGRVDGRS